MNTPRADEESRTLEGFYLTKPDPVRHAPRPTAQRRASLHPKEAA